MIQAEQRKHRHVEVVNVHAVLHGVITKLIGRAIDGAGLHAAACHPDGVFFFSSIRRHTSSPRDWSSDVCSSDLEPTGNVDPNLAQRLLRLFVELNKSGTSVVIATHDIALMDQYDARRLVLH